MDEGGVNHAVRRSRGAAQAFEVLEIAAMHLGAGRGERLGARVRAGEADHLMARADKLLNDGGADKACGAGDEDTHGASPGFISLGRVRGPVIDEIGERGDTSYAVKSVLSSRSSEIVDGSAL